MRDYDQEKNLDWYSGENPQGEFLLSLQTNVMRNLAQYAFSPSLREKEAQKIFEEIASSFEKNLPDEHFNFVQFSENTVDERAYWADRNLAPFVKNAVRYCSVGTCANPSLFASINLIDHLRLVQFSKEFNPADIYENLRRIDLALQENLRFAASKDFGYLTMFIGDSGAGLRFMAGMHLPVLHRMNLTKSLFDELRGEKFFVLPWTRQNAPANLNCGSFFLLFNAESISLQPAEICAKLGEAVEKLVSAEKAAEKTTRITIPTLLKNDIRRAFSKVFFSKLLTESEGRKIISDLKLGVSLGLVEGVSHSALNALFFRLCDMHLQMTSVLKKFDFPDDVSTDFLRIDYLRAAILQDSLKSATLVDM